MSYDLYLYKRTDSDLTEDQVSKYLTENIPFNISEHPEQWNYENAETGVYFLIEHNEKNIEQEDIDNFDSFPGFQNLNFNISINFFRPEYFGLESFPIIEKLIQGLDVFVWNPQDTESESLPKKLSIGYFQTQWIELNDQVTKAQFTELAFDYFPRDYSNYMWKFSYHRQALQDSLTEDIFVAGFILLKSKLDGKIYTTCVWPDHIPVIFPLVDYIIISRKKKKWFRSVEESGLIAYADVMKELGEYFEDYSSDIPNLKVLRQAQADQIGTKFNNLKIWKTIKEFGTGVFKDQFVNVKPEDPTAAIHT